jgi:hypothetical protein
VTNHWAGLRWNTYRNRRGNRRTAEQPAQRMKATNHWAERIQKRKQADRRTARTEAEGDEPLGWANVECLQKRKQVDFGTARTEAEGDEPLGGAEAEGVQKREQADSGTSCTEAEGDEPLGELRQTAYRSWNRWPAGQRLQRR